MKSGEKHRYQQLAEALGIKIGTLCRVSGVPSPTIKMAVSRNSSVTADVAVQICKAYPQVNYDWLMTGEGEPLNKEGILNDPDKPYQKAKTLPEVLRDINKKVKKVLMDDDDDHSAKATELYLRHQQLIAEIEAHMDAKTAKKDIKKK